MTVIVIGPRMDLTHLAEYACCDRSEAAFVLLELIAAGHTDRDLDHLDQDELGLALTRACRRMDELEIPCE